MSDTVISVKKVSKAFKLPHEKQGSVKGAFINVFKGNRSYETQKVLNNISFDIKRGEFFGIVGRNGSGKSTLLKLIAGIYEPSSGSVKVTGKLTPFIELGVGFSPDLTGRENVFLNGALLGFTRSQMEEMYDEIVAFAELEKFMDQKLKNYSSGMQVRLAFSIAVRAKTDILLIDEVLAVGDVVFQQKCFEYFHSLKQTGQTVVFVSHDMEAVKRFCDRAVVVDSGMKFGEGNAEEIVDRYLQKIFKENEQKEPEDEEVNSDISVKIANDTRDSLDIEFSFELGKKANVVLSFAVVKEGISFAHMNSKGYIDMLDSGMHTFRARINKSKFLQGNHSVSCALIDKTSGKQLKFANNAAKFYIAKSDPAKYGLTNIDAEWIKS